MKFFALLPFVSTLVSTLGPTLAFAETGKVAGAVTPARADVVVYLEGLPSKPSEDKQHPQIKQKDQQFSPRVVVVEKGHSVEFPNEDKIFHNVFSVSDGSKFDLGLYKSGESKTVTFKRAGVVDIYCNIHPNMVAKVKVVDSTAHALTGDDGRFTLAEVPPGTYTAVAWQPYGAEWRGPVTVKGGATVELAVPLAPGKPETGHLRKDGTPYGRYK